MKKTIIILIASLLTACSTSPKIQSAQVVLEDKTWEPINKNYMNKKGF